MEPTQKPDLAAPVGFRAIAALEQSLEAARNAPDVAARGPLTLRVLLETVGKISQLDDAPALFPHHEVFDSLAELGAEILEIVYTEGDRNELLRYIGYFGNSVTLDDAPKSSIERLWTQAGGSGPFPGDELERSLMRGRNQCLQFLQAASVDFEKIADFLGIERLFSFPSQHDGWDEIPLPKECSSPEDFELWAGTLSAYQGLPVRIDTFDEFGSPLARTGDLFGFYSLDGQHSVGVLLTAASGGLQAGIPFIRIDGAWSMERGNL